MQNNGYLVNANESFMRLKTKVFPFRVVAVFSGLIFSVPVFAYIGPGAGLSAIGSALALLGAVLLMILGFVWYPVKRILVRRKQNSLPPEVDVDSSEVDNPHQTSDDNLNQDRQS